MTRLLNSSTRPNEFRIQYVAHMDIKDEIVGHVHLINQLKEEKAELWRKATKHVTDNHIEDAIILLNRYFGLKEQLEGEEARLESILKGQFSDK